MNNLYNNTYRLSKFQRISFSSAVFLNFMFYDILMISLYFYLPYSLISASIRLYIGFIGAILFMISLFNREFVRLSAGGICQIIYVLMLAITITRYTPVGKAIYTNIEYGKLYDFYILVAYGLSPLFLFLMPRNRFLFFANREWLVFIPSFFSTIIILYLFGDFLSPDGIDYFNGGGINRQTIKEPILMLFVMSFYWFIFFNKFWKFLLGCIGLIISGYGIIVSSSQSILLSVFIVIISALPFAIKDKRRFAMFSIIIAITLFAGIPYIMSSKGWERLQNIISFKEAYMFGGHYDISRVDIMRDAFGIFLKNPLFGESIVTSTGSTAHFFPSDVLMSTGIIGGVLMCIVIYQCLCGALYLYKRANPQYCWMLMIFFAYLIQNMLHSSFTSMLSFPFMLMLSAQMVYRNRIFDSKIYRCTNI